jgi:hypothetical protein
MVGAMSLEACSTIQGFFRPQPKTRTETPAATKKNASESNEERAKEPAVKKHPPPPVTDSDKTDKPVGADDPFRKHDHSKYVAKVKKSATDFMNGLTDVTVARLCKDPYSDQWSLSLYFLDVKD